tara:strand:- start:138 stop:368 length:231 start_codon:yes stop_codon:yes gene_type:complete
LAASKLESIVGKCHRVTGGIEFLTKALASGVLTVSRAKPKRLKLHYRWPESLGIAKTWQQVLPTVKRLNMLLLFSS